VCGQRSILPLCGADGCAESNEACWLEIENADWNWIGWCTVPRRRHIAGRKSELYNRDGWNVPFFGGNILRFLVYHSAPLLSWTVSAVVHAVALGAMWHVGNAYWMGIVDVPAGQAVTIQGSFAAEEVDQDATIATPIAVLRGIPTRTDKAADLQPQGVTLERATPEAARPASGSFELPELELAAEPQDAVGRRDWEDAPTEELLTSAQRPREVAEPIEAAESQASEASATAIAGADTPPRQLPLNRSPVYPADALRERREGRVIVLATISVTGGVINAEISTSSGTPSLDEAALAAVRTWRFAPARSRGEAVEHELRIPVRFRIE
jgi:TonB family protein